MEWHVKSKCLDLIWHHDILYLACQDALYELEIPKKGHSLDSLQDDYEDEDFFQLFETTTARKKKCVLADIALKVQNALLKVKFKREAICFCHDTTNEILYSLHSKGNTKAYYVEATDLRTFQCCRSLNCCIFSSWNLYWCGAGRQDFLRNVVYGTAFTWVLQGADIATIREKDTNSV